VLASLSVPPPRHGSLGQQARAASLDFIAKIAMALNADPDELVRRYRKPK